MERSAIIVLIILLNFSSKIKGQDELSLGSECKLHDNSAGVCKIARECSWAKNQIENKLITHNEDAVKQRKADIACNLIQNIKNGFSALGHHVTNGIPVQLGEYPHMAAIGYYDPIDNKTKYNCGGSLISNKFVVTASHCVNKKTEPPVTVKLGRISLDSGYSFDGELDVEIKIKNIMIHPKYSSRKFYNDIALIELETQVSEYSKALHPACLYTQNSVSLTDKLFVTGWGIYNVKNRKKSTVMLKGELSYVNPEVCTREFEEVQESRLSEGIQPEQVCAFDAKNTDANRVDACQGDSGNFYRPRAHTYITSQPEGFKGKVL